MNTRTPSLVRTYQIDYCAAWAIWLPLSVGAGFLLCAFMWNQPQDLWIAGASIPVALALFVWRWRTVAAVFAQGVEVPAIVNSVEIVARKGGRIRCIYTFQGAKYVGGSAVNDDRGIANYAQGDNVAVVIDPQHPKRAFIRDLYMPGAPYPAPNAPNEPSVAPLTGGERLAIPFAGQFDRKLFYRSILLVTTPSRRGNVLRLVALVFLLAFATLLVVAFVDDPGGQLLRVAGAACSVIMAGSYLLAPYVNGWAAAGRIWQQGDVRGRYEGQVTAQGIAYTGTVGAKVYRWEGFQRVRRTPDVWVLVMADGTFCVLPHHFFSGDMDWLAFQQRVDQNVVEAK